METSKSKSTRSTILGQLSICKQKRLSLHMAPMIDMIFLLLIFFLVAGNWRPEEDFLPFQLPVAHAQEHRVGAAEPLVIYISATAAGCQVRVGQSDAVAIDEQMSAENLGALMEKISEVMLEQKRIASDPVEIVCGGEVKWEQTAKIYNMFFGAGLSDITFRMTE
ncbi:MAG: biopolymer transporter ExbD [Planctomycetes bacterium]|nr:biopolymer transporter ExbD [Planctomycetota bacterium]